MFSKCQDAATPTPALHAAAALWALLKDTLHTKSPVHHKAELTRDSTALTPLIAEFLFGAALCCKAPDSSTLSCQNLGTVYKNLVVLRPADVLQNCPGIYTLFPFRKQISLQ